MCKNPPSLSTTLKCAGRFFISPNNDMLVKLRWLLVDFPEIDIRAMGFPEGWEMEPLWR